MNIFNNQEIVLLRPIIVARIVFIGLINIIIFPSLVNAGVADPSNLRIIPDHGATKSAELLWQRNSADETGFEIHRSIDGGGFLLATQVGPGITTWTDNPLDTAKLYAYRVRAVRGVEVPSGWTNECSVNFSKVWPINVASDADIELLHGYGDGLGLAGERLHIGVDGQDGAGGSDCRAGICGLVFNNVMANANNRGIWMQFKINGALWYYHLNHLQSIEVAASVTNGSAQTFKTVISGQKVGVISSHIWAAPWAHVHISYCEGGWADNNNRNPLSMYDENSKRDPKEKNPGVLDYDKDDKTILFRKHGGNILDYDHDTKPLSGDLSILVEIFDEQGTDPSQGVNQLKYWIEGPLPPEEGIDDVKSSESPYQPGFPR
jgi:hypothetical protein